MCVQVTVFADSLISTVHRALCDPLPEVRESAARTFDTLHSNIGSRALDDIIPHLLKKLVSMQHEFEYSLEVAQLAYAMACSVASSRPICSKTLHPQNPPVLNWRCQLTQVDLYSGRKTVVVVLCVQIICYFSSSVQFTVLV